MGRIDFTSMFVGLVIVGAILGSAVAIPIGIVVDNYADRYWQREAINAGHAEYFLDENNNRQWRWKERSDE